MYQLLKKNIINIIVIIVYTFIIVDYRNKLIIEIIKILGIALILTPNLDFMLLSHDPDIVSFFESYNKDYTIKQYTKFS